MLSTIALGEVEPLGALQVDKGIALFDQPLLGFLACRVQVLLVISTKAIVKKANVCVGRRDEEDARRNS
jgi:hypothetical protein